MKMTVNVLGYDNKGLVVVEDNRFFHVTGITPDDVVKINESLTALGKRPLRRFNWQVSAGNVEEKHAY